MLHTLSVSLLPALMIVAAMTDVTSYRIPNWLTALIAVLFFPMAWATGMPVAEFGWHIAAGLILFVMGYLMFAVGIFGGGDAKLMAAAGLWFGTEADLALLINDNAGRWRVGHWCVGLVSLHGDVGNPRCR